MIVNGILDVKLTESNGTGEMFLDILRHSIIPYVMPFNSINPSSVIVMDNAVIHHIDSVSNLLQGLGVLLKNLPAYSPDLNPIEEVFSKVKCYTRNNVHILDEGVTMRELALQAFGCVTATDCQTYIKHSGYM